MDIYKKTKCGVKINNKITNLSRYEKWVKQGDVLNTSNSSPVSLDDKYNFSALMFADDLIILSATKEGLQKSLDALSSYSQKGKLEINYKKTKCMSFSRGNDQE